MDPWHPSDSGGVPVGNRGLKDCGSIRNILLPDGKGRRVPQFLCFPGRDGRKGISVSGPLGQTSAGGASLAAGRREAGTGGKRSRGKAPAEVAACLGK